MKYTENVKNSVSKVDQIEANGALKAYWPERTGNTAQRGILMKDTRWIIPSFLDILDKIHAVHQGICRYRERGRESVWWPDLGNQIEDIIKICPTCCKHRKTMLSPWMLQRCQKDPGKSLSQTYLPFSKLGKEWGFTHITSSSTYPQSNGEVERAVQTAKKNS